MHIPKAARLMLKSLFKFDDAFFEQLETIDIAELQTQMVATIEVMRTAAPDIIDRVTKMETLLGRVALTQISLLEQMEVMTGKLDDFIEEHHIREGGLPTDLSTALDYEGKDDVEKALQLQHEDMTNV